MTQQTPPNVSLGSGQSWASQIVIAIFTGIVVVIFAQWLTEYRNRELQNATATAFVQQRSSQDEPPPGASGRASNPPSPTRTPRPAVANTAVPRRDVVDIHCPGAHGPSFAIGDRFVVPHGDGASGLFPQPNQEPKFGSVQEGEGGYIIGGPVCKGSARGINNDGTGALIVWRVELDEPVNAAGDRVGWMAEGYPESVVPWIEPDD